MAAVLAVLCICMCSSFMASAAWLLPFPEDKYTTLQSFKNVSEGRLFLDRNRESSKMTSIVCADNCGIDWTCKGFQTWDEGDVGRCLKFKETPNPLLAFPGWFTSNKKNPKIYIKK